ncbi:MAG: bifunctional DNA-formamidopyrimidine glycosylase/DNA-(apurinic or apyrimidinic site) lyase [Gammaproteobacteria bacterium]|nr:bifunctional DNA-formamidopyrimidine glycosylase/DNA-(apurinic or apyrimidinic site) lyase [Gammaproteobacteria bacterium]NVK89485.1 bifunctional DNA-formamidopyrimidine glycosylase/DNA-(apurinic or apyrimidinic site) lyase [Gammaproteobacteria bacterium]
MPELPEVETSRRGIAPHLTGQTIRQLIVRNAQLRWPIPDDLAAKVNGQEITQITRRAKYLLLALKQGAIMVHLGMSGRVRVVNAELPAEKHDHVDLVLASGQCLRFTDPRRFGSWLWHPSPRSEQLLSHLGPEPLTDEFNFDYLYPLCRNRKAAIKQVIMDNQVVVGVGNIYATEALFASGIRPTRSAQKVTQQQLKQLIQHIKRILAAAIEQGGTTLKDFTRSDGKPGYFKQALQVYGRAGEACDSCGSTIKTTRQGQRASAYCPSCQK